MKTKCVANDGAEFDDAELCLAYEKLVEASKDRIFHKTVESLFMGCTSFAGRYDDDDQEKVFRIEDRSMGKFKVNLVRALPELQRQLADALASVK